MATYAPTAADFDALVHEARARGIDPLDVALVLYFESAGFEPGKPSARYKPDGSFSVGGLNQMAAANLAAYGIAPDTWLAMTAAQQLPIIFRFWDGLARTFAGGAFPPDDVHLEALNYLPARYRDRHAATDPHAVLSSKTDADGYYNAPLDPRRTGSVSLDTIRDTFAQLVATPSSRWAMVRDGVVAAVARLSAPAPPVAPGPPSPSEPPPPTPRATPNAKRGLLAIAVVALTAAMWRGRTLLAALAALAHVGGCS